MAKPINPVESIHGYWSGATSVFDWQCAQVGVEKVTLNGRVRITLKPLMDEMPIVAAMQVRPFCWYLLIALSGQ